MIELAGRAGAECPDAPFFLHDINIIPAFLSGDRIAHILQMVQHIFLAVKIIGNHIHMFRPSPANRRHFLRQSPSGGIVLMKGFFQGRRPFHRQRMHSDIFRSQSGNRFHGMFHMPGRFTGQPQYDIHIDAVKAGFPSLLKSARHIFCCMVPAHPVQRFLIHGLRVDADPGNAIVLQQPKLLWIQTVRPAGFHRIF